MRKRVINRADDHTDGYGEWLNLEHLAQVEVTSEEADYPVEAALLLDATSGWRAVQPGEQVIRIVFDQPQTLRRISLLFQEQRETRTQEFVLRWAQDVGAPLQDIARQQYNFSPAGANQELEDYQVDLNNVKVLELSIIPDLSRGHARASLERLRLASSRSLA